MKFSSEYRCRIIKSQFRVKRKRTLNKIVFLNGENIFMYHYASPQLFTLIFQVLFRKPLYHRVLQKFFAKSEVMKTNISCFCTVGGFYNFLISRTVCDFRNNYVPCKKRKASVSVQQPVLQLFPRYVIRPLEQTVFTGFFSFSQILLMGTVSLSENFRLCLSRRLFTLFLPVCSALAVFFQTGEAKASRSNVPHRRDTAAGKTEAL